MTRIIENSIGMAFVEVPAGSFRMGGDPVAEQADENENPRHVVVFDAALRVGRCPVTQSQWQAVMGGNPSHFHGADHPVESVSHDDAREFIRRLNALEKTRAYRLPTEAEWEYAARAGSPDAYCYGPGTDRLHEFAWYAKNSGGRTRAVGRLAANAWGLHDMHGLVHEWCADWFDRNYYSQSPEKHPKGPARGVARSLRGGDWSSADWYCRSAIRSLSSPQRRSPRVGFRIVAQIEGPKAEGKAKGLWKKVFPGS